MSRKGVRSLPEPVPGVQRLPHRRANPLGELRTRLVVLLENMDQVDEFSCLPKARKEMVSTTVYGGKSVAARIPSEPVLRWSAGGCWGSGPAEMNVFFADRMQPRLRVFV
jgi:hypothetical protein